MKKWIAMVLLVCVCVQAVGAVSLGKEEDIIQGTTYTQLMQDEILAKEMYKQLTEKAKIQFHKVLAMDDELYRFHQQYVDSSFQLPTQDKKQKEGIGFRSAVADPMGILHTQLSALQLPTAVLYGLEALGASFVAALADGPLPVGDLIAAISAVGVVGVIVAHWDAVAPKWNQIVQAFQKAFTSSTASIIDTFLNIKNQIHQKMEEKPTVFLQEKTVIINGVSYHCNVKADSISSKKLESNQYFPAVLYKGNVYVATSQPVNTPIAKLFMIANHHQIGIWATSDAYARGLCGGNSAIWHNTHDQSEGYFPHYHHPIYKNFHCWYAR